MKITGRRVGECGEPACIPPTYPFHMSLRDVYLDEAGDGFGDGLNGHYTGDGHHFTLASHDTYNCRSEVLTNRSVEGHLINLFILEVKCDFVI